MIFKQKFSILPHKLVGWKRLLGQEVPVEATTDLSSITGSSGAPAAVSNLVDSTGVAVSASIVNAADTSRRVITVVNGPQTPQATQPILDMWIPFHCTYLNQKYQGIKV